MITALVPSDSRVSIDLLPKLIGKSATAKSDYSQGKGTIVGYSVFFDDISLILELSELKTLSGKDISFSGFESFDISEVSYE